MLEVQFLRLLDRAEPRIGRTLAFPTVRLPTCVHAHNVFDNRFISVKKFARHYKTEILDRYIKGLQTDLDNYT